MGKRLQVGALSPTVNVSSIAGHPIVVPSPNHALTHLQFRRFAGCPICNLHLRSIAKRIDEIHAAGIYEVAVFHSTRESMLPFQGDLPMAVIADPDKALYAQFGVEKSLCGLLHPSVSWGVVRGMLASHPSGLVAGDEGGHLGMPADFLIGPDGRVLAAKYGAHANDQWSVDELLTLAAQIRNRPADRGPAVATGTEGPRP